MARGVKFIKWDLNNLIEQVRSVCVIDEKGCWLWSYGDYDREWYAEIMINRRRQSVPRWVLEVSTGQLGPTARHTCDRMRCCNPDHLIWGTQADNVHDAFERGRRTPAKPKIPRRVNRPYELARGESHGMSKLTDEIVTDIRKLHATGISGYRLAKDYNVTKRTIQQIVRRKTWTHLPD